jgi:hypothetical protein
MPKKAGKDEKYYNMLELLDYARDHIASLDENLDVAMTDIDKDRAIARIRGAVSRLSQLEEELLK